MDIGVNKMIKNIRVKRYLGRSISVRQLPCKPEYSFLSDSQDIQSIREYVGGRISNQFDSFFVLVEDGD